MRVNRIIACLFGLIMVLYTAGCDGPIPQPTGGDDNWPLTGLMAMCQTVHDDVYLIHADNSLWKHVVSNDSGIPELIESVHILDDVRAVHWAGGGYATLAHKHDGSLWLDSHNVLDNGLVKLMDNVRFSALGMFVTYAVTTDGDLWEWKSDPATAFNGYPFITDEEGEILPPELILQNVANISVGRPFSLIVTEDGGLWRREYDPYFESAGIVVGIDKVMDNDMDDVKRTFARSDYAMAIDKDNGLWSWGINGVNLGMYVQGSGKLGNGTTEGSANPVLIMDDVRDVSITDEDVLAVTNDGSLWYWGGRVVSDSPPMFTEVLSPVKLWDDGVLRIASSDWDIRHRGVIMRDGGYFQFAYDVDNGSHIMLEPDREHIRIAENISLMKIAEDVLFEYCNYIVKTDGSLWCLFKTDTNLPSEYLILPAGTARTY